MLDSFLRALVLLTLLLPLPLLLFLWLPPLLLPRLLIGP